jgi:hypothetical protein
MNFTPTFIAQSFKGVATCPVCFIHPFTSVPSLADKRINKDEL